MSTALKIKMIKELLIKAIQKFAKQFNSSDQVMDLVISAKNPECEPQIHIYKDGVFQKEIKINDLYSRFDVVANLPGVKLDVLIPEYLSKFILKVANDKGISVMTPSFGIMLQKEILVAVMYIDGKLVKFNETRTTIPIEYILETK